MIGIFAGIVGGCCLLGAGAVIRGRVLRIRRVSLDFAALPDAFDGFRICLISDLHERRYGRDNQNLRRKIREQKPDVVLLAGDVTPRCGEPDALLSLLSGLAADGIKTYVVSGNHDPRADRHHTPEQVARWQEQIRGAGAVLLENQTVLLRRGDDAISLTGVGWLGRKEAVRILPNDGFRLLLCHDPLLFDEPRLPELMLSGHIHGGLVRLPGIGAVFAPGDGLPIYKRFRRDCFFPKYHQGIYEKPGARLAVTVGLGCSVVPFRVIRPEIMILDLKKSK